MTQLLSATTGLGDVVFESPVLWFVYIGSGMHRWRYVYAGNHCNGEEAIDAAEGEAKALGNEPAEIYMACPVPAITTRSRRTS